MAIFYLTYDLTHEDGLKHYQSLREELTRLRAHQVLENACLINLNTVDPKRLVESLQSLVEDADRIFAARLEPRSYWYVNARRDTNDWLTPTTVETNTATQTTPEPAAGYKWRITATNAVDTDERQSNSFEVIAIPTNPLLSLGDDKCTEVVANVSWSGGTGNPTCVARLARAWIETRCRLRCPWRC